MAKGTLGQVIQRAISDAAFRNRLRTDPGGALSGFDLTPAEHAALQSGDAAKLASFGVDQRMSKAFAMGEAASGASRLVGTDIGMATTITDGGTPLGTNAILDDTSGDARSALDDTSGSVRSALDDTSGTVRSEIRDDGGPFDSGSVDAGTATGREGSAFATADEMGNDAVGTGATANWNAAPIDSGAEGHASSLAASDSNATSAFITADEAGNTAVGTDATANWNAAPIDGGAEGHASSLAASDSNATDAFLTADEMGNDVVAGGRAPDPDTALTQNDALADGTATANPEGYEQPDPNAG